MPNFSLLTLFVKKPFLALATVVPTMSLAPVVDLWGAVEILVYFFIGDFFSGLLASYFEWKKSDRKDRWFFGKGEGYSSDKFKKMFVKLIIYLGSPLVVNKFQEVYALKNLKYSSISESELSIATAMILLFCLNEGYSIFHENLPKCGFNLFEIIKRIIGLKKQLKNDLNDV